MARMTREDRLREHAMAILGGTREEGVRPGRRGGRAARSRFRLLAERATSAPRTAERAASALERLHTGAPLTRADRFVIEAIILPKERPVADIRNGTIVGLPEGKFSSIVTDDATRARMEAAIASVGCILIPENPRYPYAGTGFVVGPGLVMTNRHVAQMFAEGVGTKRLSFIPGQTAEITPQREAPDKEEEPAFRVRRVAMVHPYWDMALLEVPDLPMRPLSLLPVDPGAGSRLVGVVGYPAFDERNDPEVQNKVFHKHFSVKRFSPGYLEGRRRVESFGRMVDAATHDASTLGGNSGSAVIDVETGHVIAIHFAGVYLDTNYAVPALELSRDSRVVDAGVSFTEASPSESIPWADLWTEVDAGRAARAGFVPPRKLARPLATEPERQPAPGLATEPERQPMPGAAPGPAMAASGASLRVTVPIELAVRVDQVATGGAPAAARAPAAPPLISPRASGLDARESVGPELLALVEAGRRRPYYARAEDEANVARYYAGIDRSKKSTLFKALSALLSRTHARTLRYDPSRHVYPWIDLRPNRKLASLYSGASFDPEELILLDRRVDEERAQRMAERLSAESLSPGRAAEIEESLEALLPYNCEHVVPQSWFSHREPMRGDLHHLFACERRCNSFRGNRSYWEFAEEGVMEDCGRNDRTHFQPKAGRGAAARATLYFLVRYPGEIASRRLTSGQIDLLRRWSREDGVSNHERHRNQAIFEIQGNRNPFVDFPELARDVDLDKGLG